MLRILLIAALVVVVSCTAEAVADDPATPTGSYWVIDNTPKAMHTPVATATRVAVSSDNELVRCISLLAWLSAQHQHYADHGFSDYGHRSGLVTGGAVAKVQDDKKVAALVDEYCNPFISPAVLDTFRVFPTPTLR